MTHDHLGAVLVTGGAGFIGCALAAQLAPMARRWVVLDNLHPQVHSVGGRPADLHEAAELVVGDVTDADAWSLLDDIQPELVIHLAAETGTAQSLDEASRHGAVNVVGTTRMLDAFGARGIAPSHILLSSSRAVYGEGAWQAPDGSRYYPGQRSHSQLAAGRWDAEGTPLPSSSQETVPHPTSIYGATKLAQENILSAWSGSKDVRLTVLRLQNVYGPGQSLANPYTGIVSLFSQLAMEGAVIPLYEDGQITRDFVFIEDVVSAFAAAAARGEEPRACFDVGSGEPSTIAELAEVLSRYHGAPAPVVGGRFRDGDVRHASCSIDATRSALDWTPRWSLEQGVGALQEWIAKTRG
ncbi:MAG: NAD-dependent epimerase/dehydratase family protein [Blastococcus sp.]|jgi:dTDP-L-rhamnose 4-epimerase|nr:NAD-dependent epimerase/dehydratase family protein [Blastococcus sp.]